VLQALTHLCRVERKYFSECSCSAKEKYKTIVAEENFYYRQFPKKKNFSEIKISQQYPKSAASSSVGPS
jgi:hypothetical protein